MWLYKCHYNKKDLDFNKIGSSKDNTTCSLTSGNKLATTQSVEITVDVKAVMKILC